MVLSKINKSVSYPEIKTVDKADENKESWIYQLFLKNVEVLVGVGAAKNTYENKNIIYYPIYLIKKDEKVVQVGIFEVKASDVTDYELALEHMESPLVYSFATREYLHREGLAPEESLVEYAKRTQTSLQHRIADAVDGDGDAANVAVNIKDVIGLAAKTAADVERGKEKRRTDAVLRAAERAGDIPEERKDTFTKIPNAIIPPMLAEEIKTHKQAEYTTKRVDAPWIQNYMHNEHFDITDNEGGGDCLFATIRDAFASIGQTTSVAKLRAKLADECNQHQFDTYKNYYDMCAADLENVSAKEKELKLEHSALKTRFANSTNRTDQQLISANATEIKKQYDRVKDEKGVMQALVNEVKIMKNVNTLDDLRRKIKTCEFWADIWAISTLERALNIKFIILSSEYYQEGDEKNVLQCGGLSDSVLEQRGVFTPEYYIIVDYTGDHYKLISYHDHTIFKFTELPYDLKTLILEKCLERNAGPFAIIPDFQQFKLEHRDAVAATTTGTTAAGRDVAVAYDDLTESKLRGYYDDSIVFQFYIKSADKPLPGKGSGEKIPADRVKEFVTLSKIPEWRAKLSNFWVQPFSLDNHKWSSVENYYQGSKFKKTAPEFYLSFSLDSGTELSRDPTLAKEAGGKTGKSKTKLLRPREVTIDSDFYSGRNAEELSAALHAKFSQNEDLRRMLLATEEAKLMHYIRGSEPEVADELMILRAKLRKL